jgi:hypothetical protein
LGFLFCEECNGYYELQEGESSEDYKECECGEKLKYVENLNGMNLRSSQREEISFCSACGKENKSDAKFCGSCGKNLTTTSDPSGIKKRIKPVYCPKCGVKNINDAKFCENCGQQLENNYKKSTPKRKIKISFTKTVVYTAYALIVFIAFIYYFTILMFSPIHVMALFVGVIVGVFLLIRYTLNRL